MKLVDFYNKPLKEVLEDMELIDMRIHSNDDGEVAAVELKYKPKEETRNGANGSMWNGGH